MDPKHIRRLLARFKAGEVTSSGVIDALRHLPFEDVGDARIDHHRRLRRGAPEIIYGEGKTPEQVRRIFGRMLEMGGPVIATRLSDEALEELAPVAGVRLHPSSRLAVGGKLPRKKKTGIVVCCAGTTDLPVADEAALVLEALGHEVVRLTDVGIAGLHRLLATRDELSRATVIIAVAGMEGALPSVVAGMVDCPVIGVPTSVGYGASFGGVSALLSMLNSCSGGLVTVNIDNGLGAALAADLMVRRRPGKR